MRKISKKTGADAVWENAMGHNSKNNELLQEYVTKYAKIQNSKDGLRGKEKDLLNEAKADGFLKTSIKDAVRELRMTVEQRQAENEIALETKRITALCKDLPLFAQNDDEDQEEAA